MVSKLSHRESSNVQLKMTWWLFNQMVHDRPVTATTTLPRDSRRGRWSFRVVADSRLPVGLVTKAAAVVWPSGDHT